MNNGFIKVAAASPPLRVADCKFNAAEIVKAAWRASTESIKILIFPELCITGYTCGDLFSQKTLQDGALEALQTVCQETADLDLLLVVGVPVLHKGKLYNCAAVVQHGMVLGFVPKTHLPNYNEFYELRQFCPAFDDVDAYENGWMEHIPIGTNLLFRCEDVPELVVAVEICEDLWVPAPPSAAHAAAGATLIANLSASSETVGKMGYRRALVEGQSARLACGYVYADAGSGESSTDLVFGGHCIVAENGVLLAETALFEEGMAISEIDVQAMQAERRRLSTFPPAMDDHYLSVPFTLETAPTPLSRPVSPTPFVPRDQRDLSARCETILGIQTQGLCKRMRHIGAKHAVIGVSGGLDSSLALLVTARAFAKLGLEAANILAFTMPGYGTTARTRGNAEKLCEALGVTLETIDITKSVEAHFADIGHDPADHSIVFENAQARMRTLILMDKANQTGGIVVGTGDLSELALGWATYNGDHMSMYGLNASVPKTLIRHLIAYEAGIHPELDEVLRDIIDTPVSPELLPADGQQITQQTENILGPYEFHDFVLYYVLRWGFAPTKIFNLAKIAFNDRYAEKTMLLWMTTFFKRFFSQQYKRSCMPDGPKVGSVSLSPRGDWKMPSDACATAWLAEVEQMQAALEKAKRERH